VMSIVFVLLACFSTSAEETTPTSVIYLLDVSGSMSKGGLFENIKVRLKELVTERKVGDEVILGTFSDSVLWPVRVNIRGSREITDIKKIVDHLEAKGLWTWMSRAFKETKDKAQDIKAKSPETRLMIYILTDCINDPPPEVKKAEPPWKFVEVLLEYFEGFKAEETYIYLLSYRPLKPEEKKEIEEKTVIVPTEVEPGKPPIFPRIVLSVSGFDFGKVDLSEGEVTQTGEIRVQDLQDVEPGKEVQFIPPPGFKVEPKTIECKEPGQKERVSIIIPSDLHPGEHAEFVKVRCEKASVEPSKLKFFFSAIGER
jgi:hypothetical protein